MLFIFISVLLAVVDKARNNTEKNPNIWELNSGLLKAPVPIRRGLSG